MMFRETKRLADCRRQDPARLVAPSAEAGRMPKVDVAPVAAKFDAEIKEYVASVATAPLLVGFLANSDSAALMYAKMTRRACERNGVRFELREVDKFALEEAVIEANGDTSVSGILVYYPVFGGNVDDYLRDVISY